MAPASAIRRLEAVGKHPSTLTEISDTRLSRSSVQTADASGRRRASDLRFRQAAPGRQLAAHADAAGTARPAGAVHSTAAPASAPLPRRICAARRPARAGGGAGRGGDCSAGRAGRAGNRAIGDIGPGAGRAGSASGSRKPGRSHPRATSRDRQHPAAARAIRCRITRCPRLGTADRAHLRGRPAALPALRRQHADHRVHHRARREMR